MDSPDVVSALGKLSEALETTERARGRLYDFHQLTGAADLALDEAVSALRGAGHEEAAQRIQRELIGRNVIQDRWTYQLIEDYDDNYYTPFRGLEQALRAELGVQRHEHERRLQAERRDGKG